MDSHMHLFPSPRISYVQEIVDYLQARGDKAIAVSTGVKTSLETLRIGKAFPNQIIPFVGIHPGSAPTEKIPTLKEILYQNHDVRGIGEIGLDGTYTQDGARNNEQRVVFDQMLLLAKTLNKPVSVHSRGAVADTLLAINRSNLNEVLLHWFAGNESELKDAQGMGYNVSFGPAAVYSKRIQRLVKISDPDLTLVESDGPVRFSACFDGHSSDPRMIGSVINTLAFLWGMSYSEASSLVTKNTLRYLKAL